MYRVPARRILSQLRRPSLSINCHRLRRLPNSPLYSTAASHEFPDRNPNFTSSTKKSSATEEEKSRRHRQRDEEKSLVISASLRHVPMMGWTEAAMIAGARDAGVSPSIIGSLPRKEAALVEFFMDECLQKLIDTIDSDESLKGLILSDRISKLIRIRLELQAHFISKWAQALSIQFFVTHGNSWTTV